MRCIRGGFAAHIIEPLPCLAKHVSRGTCARCSSTCAAARRPRSGRAKRAARLEEAGYAQAARLLRDVFAQRRYGTGVATLSMLGLLLGELLG